LDHPLPSSDLLPPGVGSAFQRLITSWGTLPFRDLLPPGVGSAFQRLITSWGTLPFSDLLPPGVGFFFFLLPFRVWGWLCLSATYYLLGHPSFQRLTTSWGTLPFRDLLPPGVGFFFLSSAFQSLGLALPFSDLLPPGAPFLSATYYLLGHPSFQRLTTSWGWVFRWAPAVRVISCRIIQRALPLIQSSISC
jgi:hypothetical protein